MKDAKKKDKSLLDLFLKKVKKEDLPKRDPKIFQKERKARRKLEKEAEKLQYEIEKIEAPIYKAKVKAIGLNLDEIIEISKKRSRLYKKFFESSGKEYRQFMFDDRYDQYARDTVQIDHVAIDPNCKDVTIRVCKEKVCVDYLPAPLTVDKIELWGSDGTFARLGNNRFTHSDVVYGSSYREYGMYHRRWQTHGGTIKIESSAELVEEARIGDIGIAFNPGPSYPNSACANGDDPIGLVPSLGRAQMFYQFWVSSKKPEGEWVREYYSGEDRYWDTGERDSRLACLHNVLGITTGGGRTLFTNLDEVFPKRTQFSVEASLRYLIKAGGYDSSASVSYDLRIEPYMNLAACTMEYPEWVNDLVPP